MAGGQLKESQKNIIILSLFALITIILWQMPFGNYILYPFTILGTWFHEMGHGLAAIALGGNFHLLEIYSDGSGLAMHSGSLFLGSIGRAIVAAAGPIGPTIAGALFIISSRKRESSRPILIILSAIMLISCIIWVRSIFGLVIIIAIALGLIYIAFKSNKKTQKLTVQFLGVQALASVYLSTGYLLSRGGYVEGRRVLSDTEVISQSLFLPYWFWGLLIIALSFFIILISIISVYKHK